MSRDFDIFMSKHLAGQWQLNSYPATSIICLFSLLPQPETANPASPVMQKSRKPVLPFRIPTLLLYFLLYSLTQHSRISAMYMV